MTSVKIDKRNVEEILGLSPMQEGMLYHYMKNPKGNQYHEQIFLRMSGSLDLELFKQAWLFVMKTNQALRTVFAWKGIKTPVQIVLKQCQLPIQIHDCSKFEDLENTDNLPQIKADDLRIAFDLERGPLFRVILCVLPENQYEMILSHHHIIIDGWSTGIILKEFFAAYQRLSTGRPLASISKIPMSQYLKWLKGRDVHIEKEYWRDYLTGLETKSALPTHFYRHGEVVNIDQFEMKLSATLTHTVESFAQKEGVTVASLFNACWGLLLQCYNNGKDASFGVTVSGRPAEVPGIEDVVGLFLNTVPVRVTTDEEETVRELVQRVQADGLARKGYEYLPLVEIKSVSELALEESLFHSLLVVENYPLEGVLASVTSEVGLEIDSYSAFEMTNYQLTIVISLFDEIGINFIYNSDLFKRETIEKICTYFTTILEETVRRPETKVKSLQLLSSVEQNLLQEFNQTERVLVEKPIPQIFAEQARRLPNQLALMGGEGQKLTYQELNEKANRLAKTLTEKGVLPEKIVAIMAKPSLEMIVGIMAILKAGGAYLPISPDLPFERIDYMLQDSQAELLLTSEEFDLKNLSWDSLQILNLQQESNYATDGSDPKVVPDLDQLAYLIYTSGSTGRPKGVLVEHGSLINTLASLQQDYPLGEQDRWLLKTTFMFDVSLTEIFGWILGGGTLVILEAGGEKEPQRILEAIQEYQVTHLNFVPSMFNLFIDYVQRTGEQAVQILEQLKYLMVAGEAITQEQVLRFYQLTQKVEFVNLYGPTEATIYATQFPLREAAQYPSVPIGTGLANTRLYILDQWNNPQPIGFPGELCIAGKGLARGYLNRPDLTQEKFVSHPVHPEERIYRTGDLACWLPDGNIQFLGRLDHQVKVRGYRIELGEIEAQLLTHPQVKEVVVLIRGDELDQYLIAYYVGETEIGVEQFQAHLTVTLPEYMVPSYFVQLEQMPLSGSGKLDRKALPDLTGEMPKDSAYQAPRNVTEEKLAQIWAQLLGLKKISIQSNFFKLGGHSLKATRLVGEIFKAFGVELPVKDIFQHPTLEGLARHILQATDQMYAPIQPVELQDYYPVSSAQKRLFILQQYHEASTHYNMPGGKIIIGDLDVDRLEQSFQKVIHRHEGLRSSFRLMDGKIVQQIWLKVQFALDDLSLAQKDVDQVVADFVRPFDLSQAPLLRVKLIRLQGESAEANMKHLLLFDMHHIISDGTSLNLLVQEVLDLYQGKELEPVKVQYKDFTVWQHDLLAKEKMQQQEQYWLNQFAREIPVLNLPTDYPRPSVRDFAGGQVTFTIDPELTAQLKEVAAKTNATLYMVLLSLYYILLAKYTQQKDLVIGTPVAGRNHPDLHQIIGVFVNTLALRTHLTHGQTYKEFLAQVREMALEAFDHQDYQFETLVDQLNVKAAAGHHPLFDVTFTLENVDEMPFKVDDLEFVPYNVGHQTAKFDLGLSALEKDGQIECTFDYSTQLFKTETIGRMAGHLLNIATAVMANIEMPLAEVELMGEDEREYILSKLTGTPSPYPKEQTIPQLFAKQVLKTPDQVAVYFEGEELSYRQLNEKANQLARLLRQRGVGSEQIVGIMVEPSVEMIVGVMAIVKAGAAYLPIDPKYPENRIQFMLTDSQAPILLTQTDLLERVEFAGEVLNLEHPDLYSGDSADLEVELTSHNLAYVIYTSGSTGKPKGVLVQHQSLINLIYWYHQAFEMTDQDRSTKYAGFGFDASVWEIFPSLLVGATLYVIPAEMRLQVEQLHEYFDQHQITISFLPTQLCEQFMDVAHDSLRVLYTGGDKLKKYIPQNYRLVNNYGPTEATVCITSFVVDQVYSNIPIGSPIFNTQIYILNEAAQLQPMGVPGELWIGGDALARGYLNQEELTQDRFLPNPFKEGERMYRTGDLVRLTDQGQIEFLGRIDQQVKIRGFRIELSEIEKQILAQPGVKEAVVLDLTDSAGDKYLAAYLVTEEEQIRVQELKGELARELPDYMIPAHFITVEQIPVTPNGKVDRKGLPVPELVEREYIPPANVTEEKLATIWREILGVEQVGTTMDFFELGGHSLKATALISRVFKEFQVEIPLQQVFATPTIQELARFILAAEQSIYSAIEPVAVQDYYPLSSAQKRLFVLEQLAQVQTSYNISEVMLLQGDVDLQRLEESFRKFIQRHEALRTSFVQIDGQPMQKVHADVEFALEYGEVHLSEEPLEQVVAAFIRPFNLEEAPLLRVGVFRLVGHEQDEQEEYLLIFDVHHIVADGFSMKILIQEMVDFYHQRELPELRVHYKDFTIWQDQLLASEKIKAQEAYWLEKFAGEIPVLNLPTDQPRPLAQSFHGGRFTFNLDQKLSQALRKLVQKTDTTMYITLLAAYNVLLAKYAGQEDIIVGTPIAGRNHLDLEQMVGMFVNTLAMRNFPVGSKSFEAFLQEVKKNSLQAYENQDYQFEMLLEKLNLKRDLSRNPLFDVMFALQDIGHTAIELAGAELIPYPVETKTSKFDLTLFAVETDDLVEFMLEYSTQLFQPERMERLAKHFVQILQTVVEYPEIPLQEIRLITEEEKEQILIEFNQTKLEIPQGKLISQLFQEQAAQNPDQVALIVAGNEVSYGELNARANQVARQLRAHGVKPNEVVGIMLERSLEMLVGIMGILKAGAAYLPISPDLPEQRIQYMLKDSEARFLLVQDNLDQGGCWTEEVTQLNLAQADFYTGDDTNLELVNGMDDLAYVIYTSGSTGQPKGVLIEHGNLLNTLASLQNAYPCVTGDVWLLKTTFMFDVSVSEIFGWILGGACLAVLEPGGEKEPQRMLQAIQRHRVTHLNFVPSMFSLFVDYVETEGLEAVQIINRLKYIMVAGEAILQEQVQRFYNLTQKVEFINLYGPTEATIYATQFPLAEANRYSTVPIGKGIANTHLYILDQNNQLQPIGIPGELCIGGAGVARGYLNQPDLTAERFILNPYRPQERIYRTGDLATWLPDGNIEFLGRLDHQVKVRGYRIELGEIEAQLLTHSEVKEAVALVKGDALDKDIVAYYVGTSEITMEEFHAHLQEKLPEYMVPAYFVRLEEMPLSRSGKVDRKALPEVTGQMKTDIAYQAARNATEKRLIQIWTDLLGVEKIGVFNDFFKLGGHSLKATRLVGEIYKEFGVQLTLKDIFKNPTIEKLALLVADQDDSIYASIESVEPMEYYPISSAQKRLFILNQMDRESTSYNMPGVTYIEGQLDSAAFVRAFEQLVERHESLRTSFHTVNGEIMQKVYSNPEFKVKIREEEMTEADVRKLFSEFVRPFDLSQAPLFRVELIPLTDRSVMLYDLHHIISDGVSMSVLLNDFAQLYQGHTLPELRIQYKDFAAWQQELFASEMQKQEAYWLETFADEIPVLDLPTDYLRPGVMSFAGDLVNFEIEADLLQKLDQLSHKTDATLYMILLAAYTTLLAKYTGQDDIVVGSPIAGRPHPDLEKLIGMFVNTLALRNQLQSEQTFSQYLETVKGNALQAYEHQDYPFERLVEQLDLERNLSKNPLFDTVFAYLNTDQAEILLDEVSFVPCDLAAEINAKFDLTLHVTQSAAGIQCSFEYCTELFKRETIERMVGHYLQILNTIATHPERKISEIEMIKESEKAQILEEFNATTVAYPHEMSIQQLFEAQVEQHPQKVALVFEEEELTYQQLNAQANQLARVLRSRGVGPDQAVAIMADKSIQMIVGVLAIVKAGGVYLPIDIDYPKSRVEFMLEDSRANLLLTQKKVLREKSFTFTGEIIDLADSTLYQGEDTNLECQNRPEDLIYIIYTSGSTGNPKGVMVQHLNVNRLISNSNMLVIAEDERILQTGSLAFDASTFEIWGALLNGASLYMISKDDLLSVERFATRMAEYQISMIWMTAPLFNQMLEENAAIFAGLRTLLVGGDVLSPKHINQVRKMYPELTVINGYGPTESTTFTTYYRIDPMAPLTDDYQPIPIGKPVSNTQVYVLSSTNQLQPIGVPGELCIGGDGLARGYLNQPDLTAEKFVPNPFAPQEKMYRSGDLVKWRIDGNIEFLGRIDHQVKIRGFRIELGEIESQLLKHPLINEAVVIDRKDQNGQKYLCAYFVKELDHLNVDGDKPVSTADLRAFLQERLPEYMIPSYFVQLEQIPLTSNGKVDRRALLQIQVEQTGGTEYVAPANEIEERLARIWAQVLEKERVGIQDNFFDLGGHSLKATSLVAKIYREFNVEIPLGVIFKKQTIGELAEHMQGLEKNIYRSIVPVEKQEYYPLSSAQRRLFIMEQMSEIKTSYNVSEVMLLEGNVDLERLETSFKKFIQRHESLRTYFEMVDGEPVQKIQPQVEFALEYKEIEADTQDVEEIVHQFIRPFKLAQPPLLRVGVFKLPEQFGEKINQYLFIFDMHHIISDGVSMSILIREVVALYLNRELPELRIQYKDFTIWQNNFFKSEKIKEQEAYWLDQFAGEIPVLDLPTDFPRPTNQSFEGDRIIFKIDQDLTQKLRECIRETETTMYIVLLAAYNVLLFKYSGQEDVIVGSPITGRTHPDLENLIGMFVNMLCMRNRPEKEKTFSELIAEVKVNALNAYENQDYQYEELVRKLGIKRDANRNPLFNVVFAMQNLDIKPIEVDNFKIDPYTYTSNISKFDLLLDAVEEQDTIRMYLEYKTRLFKRSTALEIIEDYLEILRQLLDKPETRLKDVNVSHKFLSLNTNAEDLKEQSTFNF